jgi:pimeloyl-ACP methyl ester carboxylesterase
VLNDVGPVIQWDALQRIGTYLGKMPHFESVEQAADAMWAVSTGFGPHTPPQWMALSRPMLKALPGGGWTLHYDPAIAVPFGQVDKAGTEQGEAVLWHLYDAIRARTLLLRGAQSDLLLAETAKAMAGRGPEARCVEFDGVGHAPTLVADAQVRVVRQFLLDV